jgi:outer membrane protein assembly factor BamB
VSSSNARRRRRRWPFVVLAVLLAGTGSAYAAYKTWVEAPGDVSNPNVEFSDEPQAERPRRRRAFTWPIYGYTPQRTRYLPARIRPPFKRPLWKFSGGDLMEFPPVLARNTLYTLRNKGELFAISARSGRVKWRRRVGGLAASSPGYANGRLYVTTLEPGRITALRAKDGKQVWKRNLGSRSESSPLVLKGRVYFGSENGTVYAMRARDGHVRWAYRAGGAVKAGLAYNKGLLYFGDYSGAVTAIRVKNGSRAWSTGTRGRTLGRSGNFYSTPAVAFGRVFLGNTDGRVYSFAARTGQLAWSHSTGAFVYASPAVARVPGTKPSVYIGSYDGRFYALDARSGDTIWKHNAGGKISGGATVVGRVVYFSNLGAKSTSGLDVRNGKRVFYVERGAFNPIISDGRRLYLTGYSSLYAYEPKRRRRRTR